MEVLQTSALPLGDGAGRTRFVRREFGRDQERLQQRERSGVVSFISLPNLVPSACGRKRAAERSRRRRPRARSEVGNLKGPHRAKSKKWSGKRDSNPRLRPWQGRTLPLSYSRSPEAFIVPQQTGARQPRSAPRARPEGRPAGVAARVRGTSGNGRRGARRARRAAGNWRGDSSRRVWSL